MAQEVFVPALCYCEIKFINLLNSSLYMPL